MSSEHHLPSELASFQSRLRQQPPRACGVDRDQLMYQSGWAAAEASRKRGWIWPTTSGVLAASVLVLAGWLAGGEVETSPVAEVQVVEVEVAKPQAEGSGVVTRVGAVRTIESWRLSSLQAMRMRQLHRQYQQPFSLALRDDEVKSRSMTARQLMQELLGETS